MALVVLAREGLDEPDGCERLLHDGRDLALLLLHGAGVRLNAPRVAVDDQEERGRDRERDEREAPVEVEHHAEHAEERKAVDEYAEEGRGDEVLHGVNVARHAHYQVARLLLCEEREREPLYVVVEREPEVVHDALADARRQIFFSVGRDGADGGDEYDGDGCEVENGKLVETDRPVKKVGHPAGHLLRAEDVVENDLQRPRLKKVCRALGEYRRERDGELLPVWPEQPRDLDFPVAHSRRL